MAPLRLLHQDDETARAESLDERLEQEAASSDLLDVPAAVVCARCGDANCLGCESELGQSGIIAIVAWERPAIPAMTRLWATARATTRDADTFFELLPDGPVLPALRFAAACELIAVSAMLTCVVLVAAVAAPAWLKHVATDPHARALAFRVLVVGIPAFAGLLVFAHAAHGLSLDVGAGRQGARRSPTRALRFGLYACGWDLVMGPLGAAIVAVKEGASAALGVLDLASVPRRSSWAFLRGCYRLDGQRAERALGTAGVRTALVTLVGAIVVLAAIVALMTL